MKLTLEASATDWRLQSQLAAKHTHIYSHTVTTHAYSFSALLYLFPPLHTHVLCFHHRLVSYFYFFCQKRFSVPLLLSFFFLFSLLRSRLPSFHGVCEFCSVSHNVTFIHAHEQSLSFSVFWTQTVDHALIYFSSLLFLPLRFSLSCLASSFLFWSAPPTRLSLPNLLHISPPCPLSPLTPCPNFFPFFSFVLHRNPPPLPLFFYPMCIIFMLMKT